MIEPDAFICGDCMDYLPEYPDKYFDLAVVDPPYGIGITGTPGGGNQRNIPFGGYAEKNSHWRSKSIRREKEESGWGGTSASHPKFYHAFDDSRIPDKEYFDELLRIAKCVVIWGGNYFLDYLGKAECIIVWDKKRRGINFADCEVAWTNLKEPCRIFDFRWNGMLQGDMKNKEYRIHPTQKPVALYDWILTHYAKPGQKILDTHVGSASSLIACHKNGMRYVGFEKDEYYYELASKRLEDYKAQLTIFDMGVERPETETE